MSSTGSTPNQPVEEAILDDGAANEVQHRVGSSLPPADSPVQGLGPVFDEDPADTREASKSAAVDGVDVETVIRISTKSKTKFTDEHGKHYVVERTVSQEFEQHEDNDDIFSELIKMGWNPRGQITKPTATLKPKPKPKPTTKPKPTGSSKRTSNQEDEDE